MNWDSLTLPARKHENLLVCPHHKKEPWNPALVKRLLPLPSIQASALQLSSLVCTQGLCFTCGVSTLGASQSPPPPPSVKDQATTPEHLPPLT